MLARNATEVFKRVEQGARIINQSCAEGDHEIRVVPVQRLATMRPRMHKAAWDGTSTVTQESCLISCFDVRILNSAQFSQGVTSFLKLTGQNINGNLGKWSNPLC